MCDGMFNFCTNSDSLPILVSLKSPKNAKIGFYLANISVPKIASKSYVNLFWDIQLMAISALSVICCPLLFTKEVINIKMTSMRNKISTKMSKIVKPVVWNRIGLNEIFKGTKNVFMVASTRIKMSHFCLFLFLCEIIHSQLPFGIVFLNQSFHVDFCLMETNEGLFIFTLNRRLLLNLAFFI